MSNIRRNCVLRHRVRAGGSLNLRIVTGPNAHRQAEPRLNTAMRHDNNVIDWQMSYIDERKDEDDDEQRAELTQWAPKAERCEQTRPVDEDRSCDPYSAEHSQISTPPDCIGASSRACAR